MIKLFPILIIVFKITSLLIFINVNSLFAQQTSSGKDSIKEEIHQKDPAQILKQTVYRNIGPSIMSGRVVDIEVNPADPTEFYIAYATGGLWHTINNGQSMTPIFDKENAYGLGDIAVKWSTGKDLTHTIWVGTGEANSSRSSYAGNGLYKSKNNGFSWEYLGLPESHHIGKVQLHPKDTNIAWVAVIGHLYSSNKERGVFKTTDGGKTWKHTLFINENTGVIDMDIDPKNPAVLYASAWYRTRTAWNFEEAGNTSGIYKSNDGGNTWLVVTIPGSGFPTGSNIGRIGLAVSGSNPSIVYASMDNQGRRPDTAIKKIDTNYVLKNFQGIHREDFLSLNNNKLDSFLIKNDFPEMYRADSIKELIKNNTLKPNVIFDYLFDSYNDPFELPVIGCEVYRSEDGGIKWKKVNSKGLNLYNTYGYYFGKISVAPDDANKVVIGGYNLLLSTDGGKTFEVKDKANTHADWHGCWINPLRNSHWIAGNDGGINVTYDDGAHWYKANNPAVGQFYSIAVDDAKPYNVYGGLQDNGVWYGPSIEKNYFDWDGESPYPWKKIGGGDGMQVQVDTRDNKTIYSGLQFGFYSRKNLEGGRNLRIRPKQEPGDPSLRYNWQTPILLSKHQQDILYYGSNKFHRSLNKGEKFETLSHDLSKGKREGDIPFGTMTTISESPLRFGLIYTGTDDGNLHLSRNGGISWDLINKKLPAGLYISRVRASQYKLSRVYVCLNGYRNDSFAPFVYASDDYGESWVRIGKNLPNQPVNVILEDIKHENILYAGTDNGVYTSFDRGITFMHMSYQMPNVPVHDMVIQNRENELVVGTHGRSIYITKLENVHKVYKSFRKNK